MQILKFFKIHLLIFILFLKLQGTFGGQCCSTTGSNQGGCQGGDSPVTGIIPVAHIPVSSHHGGQSPIECLSQGF
uniref:Uncharacterized protein n=1 Tax=Meloidogyne hapla TaxID=6305 RepID=A0A1I8B3M4_MELHA